MTRPQGLARPDLCLPPKLFHQITAKPKPQHRTPWSFLAQYRCGESYDVLQSPRTDVFLPAHTTTTACRVPGILIGHHFERLLSPQAPRYSAGDSRLATSWGKLLPSSRSPPFPLATRGEALLDYILPRV